MGFQSLNVDPNLSRTKVYSQGFVAYVMTEQLTYREEKGTSVGTTEVFQSNSYLDFLF